MESASSDEFDAGQIFVQHAGMPDHTWHSVALLRTVERACALNPYVLVKRDGMSPLGRSVAVTTAVARLSERGYDMEKMVRRAFGPLLVNAVMGMAIELAWFSATELEPKEWWKDVADLLTPYSPPVEDFATISEYANAVKQSPGSIAFVLKLLRWIDDAELADLVLWNLPDSVVWSALETEDFILAAPDPATLWIRDRFLQTYLADWETESLHLEFRHLQGEDVAPLPRAEMALRAVPDRDVAWSIANRTVYPQRDRRSVVGALASEALSYLRAGDRQAAAAILKGALLMTPSGDDETEGNLAFCTIPDDPVSARSTFERLLAAGHRVGLMRADLVLACIAAGDLRGAEESLALLESSDVPIGAYWLWTDLASGEPVVELVSPDAVVDHLKAELADMS